ncbi:MAG TPA: cation:proton antiporter [Actinomycetota bacterium]|nr:cation:proton antiporter [Actinomycetota bacterium]
MVEGLGSLLAAMVVVAAAPILVAFLPGRVPQVVLLIAGGIVIGPEVLDLAEPDDITLFANLGLGFLFLLAGYELDPSLLRERAGTLAIVAWVISIVLAIGVVGALEAVGLVKAFLPVAIGLTTTALGTLLPILRDHRMLEGRFGRYVFAAGAIGEMGPVLCIALLLGHYNSIIEVIGVAAVAGVAFALSVIPRFTQGTRFGRVLEQGQHETSQTTLRLTVLLLVALLFLSAEFGLDIVLGAFFAGMVLRRWAPGDVESLEKKLDAVGYGFFIPVFFVSSGMGLDVISIVEAPGRMLGFFLLLLVVRGVPALFVYRKDLPGPRRVQMMLLTATALPLLVALTEIGLQNGSMLPENAAALVGAGVLSVAIFPLLAVRLQPRALEAERETSAPEA